MPKPELKIQFAAQSRNLSVDKLFLGTSSWKYGRWLGEIYKPEQAPAANGAALAESAKKASLPAHAERVYSEAREPAHGLATK